MADNKILVDKMTRRVGEARVILNQAMEVLPDVASEVPAPLDGKVALAYTRLRMVREILKSVTEG